LGDIRAFYSMVFVGDAGSWDLYYGIEDFDVGIETAFLELMPLRPIYLPLGLKDMVLTTR
jgi:hypothetical protein